jgi:hypothetical protein
MRIDAGDAVSHTIAIPSWLVVDGGLPADTSTGYSTVRWTSAGSTSVTRTETFTGPRATHPAVRVELPVRAVRTVRNASGTVAVDVTLPSHSASSADQLDIEVLASPQTLVGIHDLAVTPTSSDVFAPGGEGTVSFLTTPTASTPVAFTAAAGTALVHSVLLPSWLEPGALPTEVGAVWTRTTEGNQVRVTRTVSLSAWTTTSTTARLQFPVAVTPTGVPTSTASVTASATVPSPLTTLAATASTTARGTAVVHDGVYNVVARPNAGSAFRPGTQGVVTFQAAAETPTARALTYQPGDVRSHTITLPEELTPTVRVLPSEGPASVVSWTSGSNSDGTWTVVRTERFTRESRDTANATFEVAVQASRSLTLAGRTVSVRATLPRNLVSAAELGTGTALLTSSPVQVGAFDLAADCPSVTAAPLRGGCYMSYNLTPGGRASDADLRAGDVITHRVTAMDGGVFPWFESTVEAETDDYRITIRPSNAAVGTLQTTVVRTIEIKRDLTTISVPAARIKVGMDPDLFIRKGTAIFGVTSMVWPSTMGVALHEHQQVGPSLRIDY